MMNALWSVETPCTIRLSTRHHIPEDSNVPKHWCENLKYRNKRASSHTYAWVSNMVNSFTNNNNKINTAEKGGY